VFLSAPKGSLYNPTKPHLAQTPREIVRRALTFETPERTPRDLWVLPWAENRYPEHLARLRFLFPPDITDAPDVYQPSPRVVGNRYHVGTHVDEWGCIFENIQEGVIGEVKRPIITDSADWQQCAPPYEILPDKPANAREEVNRFCERTELFTKASCCPRPWERMQFLRGSVNAFMDTVIAVDHVRNLLTRIHEFYLRELEFWVTTDVDAIMFMDDWGSQTSLLINRETWLSLFKPLYREYCEIAHAHNKFAFMHSDGCISAIYEDLIEIGVDAINSQFFVMDMEELATRFRGRITFWGEIDRQHVLPSSDPGVVREAVRRFVQLLHDPRGGTIAQFEFGPGIVPENALIVFEEWEKLTRTAS
jgi:uroporphyrinogen decarboxylase